MIITHLIGGLGNQMFQYALGRKMSLSNDTKLTMDISGLENHSGNGTPRKYALGVFNIQENFSNKKDVNRLRAGSHARVRRILEKRLGISWGRQSFVAEPHHNFYPKVLEIKSNTYLQGYWQTEKYFKDIEDVIRKDFSLKDEFNIDDKEIAKRIRLENAISLHVRRGDYVQNSTINKFHGICSLDYYKKGIKHVADSIQDPYFFVFSDDIEWVKENLKIDYPVTYVSDGALKDYEELTLMSYCKHNIIANSSFSWWGAWLNNNPEKIVIAPRQWFADTLIDTSDVIPENWVRF